VEELFVALKASRACERAPARRRCRRSRWTAARRAAEGSQALRRAFEGRTLIVAESAGRRETLSQFFAEHDFHPALVDDWSASAIDAPGRDDLRAARGGLPAAGERIAIVTEAELYPGRCASRARATRARSRAPRAWCATWRR
jgi:transcription-repair coupling factor (superfamily II helicase)